MNTYSHVKTRVKGCTFNPATNPDLLAHVAIIATSGTTDADVMGPIVFDSNTFHIAKTVARFPGGEMYVDRPPAAVSMVTGGALTKSSTGEMKLEHGDYGCHFRNNFIFCSVNDPRMALLRADVTGDSLTYMQMASQVLMKYYTNWTLIPGYSFDDSDIIDGDNTTLTITKTDSLGVKKYWSPKIEGIFEQKAAFYDLLVIAANWLVFELTPFSMNSTSEFEFISDIVQIKKQSYVGWTDVRNGWIALIELLEVEGIYTLSQDAYLVSEFNIGNSKQNHYMYLEGGVEPILHPLLSLSPKSSELGFL